MASLGWIDFSKKQKEHTLAILEFLKPEGKVDELGIGVVRDAIADILFPGISTIHTRAKYFFIVPNILWEYCNLPTGKKRKKRLADFLEDKEDEIMYRLAEAYENKEGHGVIGITKKRGEKIARPPSVIYWRAINTFGFVHFKNYSLDSYLNHFSKNIKEDMDSFSYDGDDAPKDDQSNNHENVMGIFTRYNKDYANIDSLGLTKDEAEEFSDRILKFTPNTLLSELIINTDLRQLFFEVDYNNRGAILKFAPLAVDLIKDEKLSFYLKFAHDFSLAMHGANITYNQKIQQLLDNKAIEDGLEDNIIPDIYNKRWEEWLGNISNGFLNIDGLNIESISQIVPKIKDTTLYFLKEWIELIKSRNFSDDTRFKLIELQEYNNKRGKARIRTRKLDDCRKNIWLGFDYLDYRYPNAKTILTDIMQPGNA